MTMLKLDLIRIDGGTQSRAELNEGVVAEYAESMLAGQSFPPVTVFFDGAVHWLADGFHRFFATKKAGFTEIAADVREGTKREAILFSLGANASHGLRRSNADKRKSVETLLADAEWAGWSDRQIAKACGVSVPFVGSVRSPEVKQRQDENRKANASKVAAACNPITPNPEAPTQPEATPAASNKPLPTPKPSANVHQIAPTGDVITEDDMVMDQTELLLELQADNERLQGHIQALEAEDTKAELRKALLQRDHSIRQQSEAMDKAVASQKREAWSKRQLMRCGKAVGEDDPEKIAAAVEAFVRQYKKAA